MAPLKTLLSTAALAFVLLLGAASNAAAAGTVPCWKQVISDWYDGRIDNVYPLRCYHEAIAHLPEDVQTYSSAKDEINRALLAALRHDRDGYGGGSGAAGAGAGVDATASGPEGPGGGEAPGGVLSRLLETLGPSNAESVPLPLLVLAVIALLLLAAAAASFVAKRVQARRPPGPPPVPATAPAQPPDQR